MNVCGNAKEKDKYKKVVNLAHHIDMSENLDCKVFDTSYGAFNFEPNTCHFIPPSLFALGLNCF
jgi:hypothetical protein